MHKKAPNDGHTVLISVDGIEVQGLLHASITNTNCFSSDTFSLTVATGSFPMTDVAFWGSLSSSRVQISVISALSSFSQSLITGLIDTIVVDPINGTVAIEGRDLSSSMIDGYRQQDFVNQTASEVVSTLAQYHGLTPMVTATAINVGRYYGDGYTRLSLGQFSRLRSDWDLVVQLARENKFDVFVQDTSLFFQPQPGYEIPLRVPLNCIRTLRFERALSIGDNTSARVQSWNSQNMASYSTNLQNIDTGSIQLVPTLNDQPFLFSTSNLTSQQVSDSAERFGTELRRLSVVLHIEMPWDLELAPRTQILIDETNSIFDATYQIDHVERHYNTMSGSSQTVRAVMLEVPNI